MIQQHAHPTLTRENLDDGVTLLTLNRPEKLNALNYELVDALVATLDAIEQDRHVRAVILTGAGRAFSAGADISEFSQSVAQGVEIALADFCRRGQRMTARIENFSKPIIAAVNGLAFGGGCEIVEATHITIASSAALFGKPEIKLGMLPTFGGTQRLPRLIGRKRALQMILCGDPIEAIRAKDMGLVNEVVAPAALLKTARDIAASMVRHSPIALAACLRSVTRGLNMSIDEGLWSEAHQFAISVASEDLREGTQAFIEKRQAHFTGR